MKNLNKMSEDHFLKIFFTCFSVSFLIAAAFMPDRGDITEGEMAAAREAILSGLRGIHDSPGSIENYYASAALSGLGWTPAEYMERIAAVTAEQVAEAAKKLTLHTTYILKGENHE